MLAAKALAVGADEKAAAFVFYARFQPGDETVTKRRMVLEELAIHSLVSMPSLFEIVHQLGWAAAQAIVPIRGPQKSQWITATGMPPRLGMHSGSR